MLQKTLKHLVEEIPESVGRPLAHVPFTFRLGPGYAQSVRSIRSAERTAPGAADSQRLVQLRSLLQHAVDEVEFYREFYRGEGFSPSDLQSWDDWASVPVVSKAVLQTVPIERRTARGAKGLRINTGGTSGQPLEFLLDQRAFAREWAHMHHIWKARGYRQQHLKLTLRGKHFDRARALRYNAVHNEYVVNANAPMSRVVDAVAALPHRATIRWVHGYPSLVAEFAHALSASNADVMSSFRQRLSGVLLGSEFPAPMYRSVIEDVLSTNVVSWYGHSEMAVLARETAHGLYESLPTYGFAEAVPTGEGQEHRLICTSLHNCVHPFIRYDTGDLIEPVSTASGSLAFRIQHGRVGDFILDRTGTKHALTAIIFGRHHRAFELLQHLQVRDEGDGRIALVVTPRDPDVDVGTLAEGFDLGDLDIDWRIEVVDSPIRTQAGKIRLKISDELAVSSEA